MNVGIDLVEIKRIAKSIQNPRFRTRVFSEVEQAFLAEKNWKPESCAANFAAKEAFAKALGTGIRGFSLNEVSVLRDALGAPFITLSGGAKVLAGKREIRVSLTHTDELAEAIVLLF